jgi:hypothetical protein
MRSLLQLCFALFMALGGAGLSAHASISTTQMAVYQGSLMALHGGSAEAISVLSPVADMTAANWPNPSDCVVTGAPNLAEVIRKTRQKNPGVKIYGYVSASADDPQCQAPPAPRDCPGGLCSNFIFWVNTWLAFEQQNAVSIDGFFVDYLNQTNITANVRDNDLSYLKLLGRKAMVNVTIATPAAISWAAASSYLGAGDHIFVEGYYYAAGNAVGAVQMEAVNQAYQTALNAKPGLKFAAEASHLAYNALGRLVHCSMDNGLDPKAAYAKFVAIWTPGSVFQWTNADLGVQSDQLKFCDNSALFP